MLLMAPRRNHNTNKIVTQQTSQTQVNTNQTSSSSSSVNHSDTALNFYLSGNQTPAIGSTATSLVNNFYTTTNSTSTALGVVEEQLSTATIGNSCSNIMSPMQTTITTNGNSNTNTNNSSNGNGNTLAPNMNGNHNNNKGEQYVRCCHPNGECFKAAGDSPLINLDDLSDCVKVICNNENCNVGQYMHRECFENWEQSVLQAFKSMGGKARSYTDRQRAQNLWSKKCYDLVYKLCGCKCSRGHLRKDLEWVAPKAQYHQRVMNGNASNGGCQQQDQDDDKKKKKSKRNRQQQQQQQQQQATPNNKSLTASLQTAQNGGHQTTLANVVSSNSSSSSNGNATAVESKNEINSSNTNNSNSNGVHNNVGVIGSGLHHQQQQQQQQQQQNQMQMNQTNGHINSGLVDLPMPSINNLLNGSNNILGLDLRPRTNSISSASNSNSGSTSPSAISFCSGEMTLTHPNTLTSNSSNNHNGNTSGNQLATLQNLNLNGGLNGGSFYPSGLLTNQQQASLMQQQHQQSSITKNILNGLQSSGLLGGVGLSSAIPTTAANSATHISNNNGLTTNQTTASVVATTALLIKQQQQCTAATILANGLKHLSPFEQQQLLLQQKVKEVELYSERVRSTSGCNGIFSRRLDFSSFNLLPTTRLNSYQVKIEDEGNHGNDETRLFILSSLAQSQKSRVACILCEEPMLVFDRYPLVDGSFFLSPKQHSTDCIEVKYEGRSLYLTCVCMRCLDGTSTHRNISCRFCGDKWDGSNLVLGTMYAYDIFAAMPCCAERLKCNNCFKLLLHPQQRLNFYSDYSHCVTCPYCATQDTHFVKPLTYCYTKSLSGRLSAIA
ncbi:hdc homolog, cell cycle regulator [Haematobia irritans]|uniref:hdc homolog, cell cycle regulator n=1 Tax=Haematobia irritans TaxID=7368 RepID=UPI003F50C4A4